MTWASPFTRAYRTIQISRPSGTHLDAIGHVACDNQVYVDTDISDLQDYQNGLGKYGIDETDPVVRRGILLDIAGLFIAANLYLALNWEELYINPFLTNTGIIMGVIAIVVILELTRRTVGLTLSIIVLVFIAYAYFGNYIPGFLSHRGYGIERIVVQVFAGTEGIYGIPVGVCATIVIIFIIFGAFIEKAGASDVFLDIASALAGGSLFLTLFWIMVISIVLGMGLPPVVSYIVLAALEVPILVEMGVHPIAAHMFIFYFCALSLITPPICTTAFTAAAIAGSRPMKTGLEAVRFGIVLYTLPYLFVYNPALLMHGSLAQIIYVFIIAGIGVYALAIAAQGFFLLRIGWIKRLLFLASSIMVFWPSYWVTCAGLVLLVAMLAIEKTKSLRKETV
ncbi:MAG: TRAP transporter large permease subunit [Desulfosalsimonas sp.]